MHGPTGLVERDVKKALDQLGSMGLLDAEFRKNRSRIVLRIIKIMSDDLGIAGKKIKFRKSLPVAGPFFVLIG